MEQDLLSRPVTPTASPRHQSNDQAQIIDEQEQPSIKLEDHKRRSSDAISSSPTQSPTLQVMERLEEHLANRCSSSSSSEWSSVSNESLFSIHLTKGYSHKQAHLLKADTLIKLDGLMSSSMEHSSQSDLDSLRVDSSSKLDVNVSSLDEPQKVVRWNTQVERLADKGVPSQRQHLESSHLSSFTSNEPKKTLCWSLCKCGSCNLLKGSSWKACWSRMNCSNCRPKKVGSSHSNESSGPMSVSPKKPDLKHI